VDYRIAKKNLLLSTRQLSASLALASFFTIVGCSPFLYKKIDMHVTGGLMNELDAVYAEAENTRDFFRPLNLDLPDHLKVIFTQHNPSSEEPISMGWYDSTSESIFVLDYQSAVTESRKTPPAFGIPMSVALWRSYLVHEITHAVVERHSMVESNTFAPTEYIAAVAQLSTLPEGTLDSILLNYRNVHAFDDESEITDLYYFMKPCEFAVKAYLHYSKPENGPSFIRQLLYKGLPESGVRDNILFF